MIIKVELSLDDWNKLAMALADVEKYRRWWNEECEANRVLTMERYELTKQLEDLKARISINQSAANLDELRDEIEDIEKVQ